AHDSLDLMAKAARVDIVHVGSEGGVQADVCRDLAAKLDRHGATTEILQRAVSESVGETLMQAAFERGSDLIVTGAFGHSRLFDFVIGAVTRTLLEQMQVPVLFSK
ncbi:MAG: universal stress protein, partial [Sideroxyarcus sp.]|nr:universal stress protein [Sideroxyarcus sp.]